MSRYVFLKFIFFAMEGVKSKLFILILSNFVLLPPCLVSITDKQYASMPDLFHLDNFDKCMLLEDEALYCSFTYELEPLNSTNIPEVWNIIKEVISDKNNYRHDHIRHGICVPLTCPNAGTTNNDTTLRRGISNCYDEKYRNMGLKGNVTRLKCETAEAPDPVDWLDISVAVFFSCYIFFVLIVSIYDAIFKRTLHVEYEKFQDTPWGRTITAFSLEINWEKLSAIKNNPNSEKLRVLQGVRLYNVWIVIFSHVAMMTMALKVSNTKFLEVQRIPTVFLATGTLCISTNFYISSFLLIYEIFTRFDGKKVINLKFMLSALLYRYLRLTPCLAAVILFYVTWLRHLETGPYWRGEVRQHFINCRKYGWMNLLYINNLLDSRDMCMPTTWYLALEMQYSIILLPVVCYMRRYPKLVWPILVCLLIVHIVGTFVHNYINDYPAMLWFLPESVYDVKLINEETQLDYQMFTFVGNLAGSIFGLGYGYIFFKYRNRKLFTSNVIFHEIFFTIVAYVLPLGIILIPGTYFLIYQPPHDRFLASLYVAVCKPVFILGIGYLIFGTIYGIGWLTKNPTTWPPSYALGRLAYNAYLIHIILVYYRAQATRTLIYGSDFRIIHSTVGDIVLTFMVALFLTLFVEIPAASLQTLLFRRKKKHIEEKEEYSN